MRAARANHNQAVAAQNRQNANAQNRNQIWGNSPPPRGGSFVTHNNYAVSSDGRTFRHNNRTVVLSSRPIVVNNQRFSPNVVNINVINRAPSGAIPVIWGRRSPTYQYYGPAPAYGNTYNFYGRQVFYTNNYQYDQTYGQPLVRRFYDPYYGGNNWRYGYRQYSPSFQESAFTFSLYLFTPYAEPCYASPYYAYPVLPPYVPATRVVVVEQPEVIDWNGGDTYQYEPARSYQSYGVSELNVSLGALSACYTRSDRNALDEIVPSNGQVAIYQENKYMYSVNNADYRQMMLDNMRDVRTTGFEITYVRRHPNYAVVRARHSFRDPNGGTDTVYQLYRMNRAGNRYVVSAFMTSHAPIQRSRF